MYGFGFGSKGGACPRGAFAWVREGGGGAAPANKRVAGTPAKPVTRTHAATRGHAPPGDPCAVVIRVTFFGDAAWMRRQGRSAAST